ncbi:hypothetical protein N7462_003999 [Penicillium macrosclerotiorum]|uniref:uncharacterized protein n=1 Tax=Penicillium macrosclerotiorum TaxID=303699 RepID=UPI00254733E2|nr:uncharacterized protein N7462_003999 [Penicillium macrosclerotiorum]KAJ5689607.1 hypothetical protein N7462_003999 [Penicillium macrosclerotiorum]
MAAACVFPMCIPGYHRAPTAEDLSISQALLPHPAEQPAVPENALQALGELFVSYGAHKYFGLHLLHGPFSDPVGNAAIGTSAHVLEKSQGYQTEALSTSDLASENVYGHVFRLQRDGTFFPYQYFNDKASYGNVSVDLDFFIELASFLEKNSLANIVALERKSPCDDSTMVMNQHDVAAGWHFTVEENGAISCNRDTIYLGRVLGTRPVYMSSKL